MRYKPPVRLEELAHIAWLTALDLGACDIQQAPTCMLSKVLVTGIRMLKENTVVKVAVAVAKAGSDTLDIAGELLNPILLKKLLAALTEQPGNLKCLGLDLPKHFASESQVALYIALRQMVALKVLRLMGGSTDKLLEGVKISGAALETINLAYSTGITDSGISVLLTMCPAVRKSPFPSTLHKINIWGTNVTTKGCKLILKLCPNLKILTCKWTAEAILILDLEGFPKLLQLEQLVICEELVSGGLLDSVCRLCPELKWLAIRRPKDILFDITPIIKQFPVLSKLTVLHFNPVYPFAFQVTILKCLTELHLAASSGPELYLDCVGKVCPNLKVLALENITPLVHDDLLLNFRRTVKVESKEKLLRNVIELKLITAPITPSLSPEIMMWAVANTEYLVMLELGSCCLIEDNSFLQLLDTGCFSKIRDIRLVGARVITNELIYTLARCCPELQCLTLKMLQLERLAQLESLKVSLRMENIDLELITFGSKAECRYEIH